jgi:hypothetical protein
MRLISGWLPYAVLSALVLTVSARAQEPAAPAAGLDDEATTAIARALATVGGQPSFYCDLTQMTKAERKRYDKLIKKLDFARREFVEINDGYSVSLPKGALTLVELADFLTLEDKCCPFFAFTVEVAPAQAATTLKIHGPAGVKKFIKSVFSEGLVVSAKP